MKERQQEVLRSLQEMQSIVDLLNDEELMALEGLSKCVGGAFTTNPEVGLKFAELKLVEISHWMPVVSGRAEVPFCKLTSKGKEVAVFVSLVSNDKLVWKAS